MRTLNMTPWKRMAAVGLAAAGLALLAGPALAAGDEHEGEDVEVQVIQEAQRVEVKVDDGKIQVWVNGERVPDERIRQDPQSGKLTILDEHGDPIQELNLIVASSAAPKQQFRFRVEDGQAAGRGPTWFEAEDLVFGAPKPAEPTVMMGVYLDEPDAALIHHLGLKPGATTIIDAVHKGLPAYEAGLRQYDIIVALDGAEEANPAALHTVLSTMEPGGDLRLTVIQAGKKQNVTVTLAKYDGEAMKKAEILGDAPVAFEVTSGANIPEEIMQQWKDLRFESPAPQFPNRMFFDDNARLYRQLGDLEQFSEEMAKRYEAEIRQYAERLAESAKTIETQARDKEAQLRERVERLQVDRMEQVERLEQRMEQLERMIEKMLERLEKEEAGLNRS